MENELFDKEFGRGGGGTGIIQMSEKNFDERDKKIKSFIEANYIPKSKLREVIEGMKNAPYERLGYTGENLMRQRVLDDLSKLLEL